MLNASLDKVLLTLHAKAGLWLQLGGHCEPGDRTLGGGALREGTEESGITGLRLLAVPVQLDEQVVPLCGPSADGHHLDVPFVAPPPARARPAPIAQI